VNAQRHHRNNVLTVGAGESLGTIATIVRLVRFQGRSEIVHAPPQSRIRDVFPPTLWVAANGKHFNPNTPIAATSSLLTCSLRLSSGWLGAESKQG